MAIPAQVDVWAGLDVGKGEHFADVLDNDGERLFARAVAARRGGPVAYVPGLVMRRAADLYPGEAETRSRRGNHRLKNAMLRTGQPCQPARPAPSLPQAA